MKRLLLTTLLIVQQPSDDTIIAGLIRQVATLQNRINQLEQNITKLTKDNEELKRKCGKVCEE